VNYWGVGKAPKEAEAYLTGAQHGIQFVKLGYPNDLRHQMSGAFSFPSAKEAEGVSMSTEPATISLIDFFITYLPITGN
jgi:hypothetical protein